MVAQDSGGAVTDGVRDMVRFVIICAILLGCAEYLTRRTPASFRWVMLAALWVMLLLMLMGTM